MASPADQIASIVRAALHGALDDSEATFEKAGQDAATAADATLRQGLFSGGFSLDDLLLLVPGLGGILTAPGNPIGALLGKAGEFILGVASGWALGEFFAKAFEPIWREITHAIESQLTSQIFDPDTAARLFIQGLMQHDHAASEAAGSGFDSDHFNHLAALNTLHPSADVLAELHRRGFIDESFLTTTLQRLGYSAEAIGLLPKLERNLLSPADLALGILRGDIDQATFDTYMKEVGITPADAQVLVSNTGEPLGLESLLEAYRRGFIDEATLAHGIRQSRVRNEWIPTAEKLRFAPMSTADTVRAVVENYLTSDEGQKIAEQNGLMPEHWDTLVKSWGRPLAHMEMASLVHRGKASRTQFDQAMRESDVKDKYIDLSFEIATPLLPERLIVTAIRYNAIDLQTGARMLLERGYTQETVSILLKLGLAEAHGSTHELTRAEITTLYQEGGLSRPDAEKHLEAIGYDATVANLLLETVDLKVHAKEVRGEIAVTRTSFISGSIDEMKASTELKQIGLSDTVIRQDIATWKREKRRAARGLTEAQIVKAAGNGVMPPDVALTELIALGYDRGNAVTLLATAGVNPTP